MQYPCTICNRGFSEKRFLEKHVEEDHKTDKPFRCQVCGITFKGKANLELHEEVKNLLLGKKSSRIHKQKQLFNRSIEVRRWAGLLTTDTLAKSCSGANSATEHSLTKSNLMDMKCRTWGPSFTGRLNFCAPSFS